LNETIEAPLDCAPQVAQIAASMVEFGFTNPILVDEADGILAGHGRLMAARQLGLTEVPVVQLGHLTPAQKRAYVITDNQLALRAGWDATLLAEELAWLRDETIDLDLLGFDANELEALLAPTEGEADAAEDEAPEPPLEPVSKPGDLWLLGDHRLLCGDATVLADMVWTDPPYNVDYSNSAKDKLRGKDRRILNDALGDGFGAFLQDACSNIVTVTKGAVYIAMSSSELHTLQAAFISAGGKWSTYIIWAKNTFTLGRADYQRQYEPILYAAALPPDWLRLEPTDVVDVVFPSGTQSPFATDETNSLTVFMTTGGERLESVTQAAMLNGANAALLVKTNGEPEVIQFRDVALNPDGSFTLQGLLRGRRGTAVFAHGHQPGEPFVLLDADDVETLTVPLGELGLARSWRAVGFGALFEDAETVVQAHTGRDLMPLAPVHVTATLAGSPTNITLAWVRRTRIGGELKDGTGVVPLGEATEAYEVDILDGPGGAVLRTLGSTGPSVVYANAAILADFGAVPSTLTVAVHQLSAVAGRGFARIVTLPIS